METPWIQLILNGMVVAVNSYLILRLTHFVDHATKEIKLLHERGDALDRILSSKMQNAFSSTQIAKGHQPYPSWSAKERNV